MDLKKQIICRSQNWVIYLAGPPKVITLKILMPIYAAPLTAYSKLDNASKSILQNICLKNNLLIVCRVFSPKQSCFRFVIGI